ncbi:MAG: ATP-binding protein, partial [bacterium]
MGLLRNLFVKGADDFDLGSGGQRRRYEVLRRYAVLSAVVVSLTPLIIMTLLGYYQYERAFKAELIGPISRLVSNAKQSLEFFLQERRSALSMIVGDKSFEELTDDATLRRTFVNLKRSFGGFVDLGLIDNEGKQRSYVGPYELLGKDYRQQEWFHEVRQRGVHVSKVFLGHREFPHFVIAVKHENPDGDWHVLRATIDSEELEKRILVEGLHDSSDAFLIDREGLLQSSSRMFGERLNKIPLDVPLRTTGAEVQEVTDPSGEPLIMGWAPIASSPFIFVLIKRSRTALENWNTLRTELLVFMAISIVLILAVVWLGSTYMVRRIREADHRRAQVLHGVEYTNRMATIGRLAAGVAHEINNPLAIINEKAGLLQDIISLDDTMPQREKFRGLADSIVASVTRASKVTHRLLGFARHMDVQTEPIDLESLVTEVLGFLEKEASYRNIKMTTLAADDLPTIQSDRGQLQQVFLNIINNAVAAVSDGGAINTTLKLWGDGKVAVIIMDDGFGIEKEDLSRIFEPFYTTKKDGGTGLGLSITYGIVQKLGGSIRAESEPGEWTRFTVI